MLAATSRRAEKLAQQQMEFVAGVSHELRTPVAVVRSAAENLSSGVVSGDRVKRYGQMIEAESRRLGDMVERVLQYAGIESGFNTAARVPLSPLEIIETAVESALPLVGPAEVTVHRDIAPDLPPVIGDATALRSAVQNLVANAVKYGGRDRWVGVRAQHVREQWHAHLKDDAFGIKRLHRRHGDLLRRAHDIRQILRRNVEDAACRYFGNDQRMSRRAGHDIQK